MRQSPCISLQSPFPSSIVKHLLNNSICVPSFSFRLRFHCVLVDMYPHTLLELLLISLSLSGVRAFAATCYFPSGDIATGNVPCNNATNGESNCCGSADACLANGLCLVNTDTDTVEFGRGACTDQTWKSPDCFQHCTGIDSKSKIQSSGRAKRLIVDSRGSND